MEQGLNIYSLIREQAGLYPEKTLIAVEEEAVTYGAFVTEVDRIGAALTAFGVKPGQMVGLILPNSVWWYKIFWAAVRIGAQPVPLDPQVGEWEMVRLLSLTEAVICFAGIEYRGHRILDRLLTCRVDLPQLKTVIAPGPLHEQPGLFSWESFLQSVEGSLQDGAGEIMPGSDTLMLACTSGSTGNPKIIVVPQRGFYQSQADMGAYLEFKAWDVMLLGMPLYHQGGFGMGLQMILKGGTVFYQPLFDPRKFLTCVAKERVTIIQLTATLAKIILSVPDFNSYDLSSVRICYFAGEVLPEDLAREFYETLGIRVINIIGSSETATMVVWDSKYDRAAECNDFRPLPFTAMRILDGEEQEVAPGEIGTLYIKTDALLTEYYQNELENTFRLRKFEGQTWFNTGDLGEKLPDGRMRFRGRAKRIVKRGANLIYPEEIEAFLLTHPEIEAVAVVGAAHDLMGEMTVAYVQGKKDCLLNRGAIAKFCRDRLAAYKIPDQVVVCDEIPHDIGKIQFKYLNKEK
ncbi:MAG TPA: class I adenylate-forming enzyme family protein [Bacillota bacterium]|nr:class I adenylate-forming enzyme family protein [Bacillota bacterium]